MSFVPVTLSGIMNVSDGLRFTALPCESKVSQPPNSYPGRTKMSGLTVTLVPLSWYSGAMVSAPS